MPRAAAGAFASGARRRGRRHFRPTLGGLMLLLLAGSALYRPLYQLWSFAKIYWIRVAHPTPRPPPVCHPRTPAGVDAGFLAGYPEASAFWEARPELAQPPQPRPDAARPLRVAVVTLCDGAMEPLCAASIDNKRAYAERHGYTLVVANDAIDPSRPAAWSKIPAVARALQGGHELVLCVDADALIMNPSLRAEDLMDWRAHQTLAADHNGPNSGVWLIRDSPWSRWFVASLWEQEQVVALPPLRSLFHYEQRAFHHLLQTSAWRRVVGLRYEHANAVRAATSLVHQCVLNALPSWYRPGDFVLHLAGVKGAAKCLLFRRAYARAAHAAGRTPGVDAAPAPTAWRCIVGTSPVAAKRRAT